MIKLFDPYGNVTLSIKNHWSRQIHGDGAAKEFHVLWRNHHDFTATLLTHLCPQVRFWTLVRYPATHTGIGKKSSVAQCSTGWFKKDFLECTIIYVVNWLSLSKYFHGRIWPMSILTLHITNVLKKCHVSHLDFSHNASSTIGVNY